jgi:threonine dehydrogenase-like Zn-dependent dehydrogenase
MSVVVEGRERRGEGRGARDEGRGVAMMKAAVLEGGRSFMIGDAPVPVPAAGEVRIRVEGSGLCASSLPVWEGREWFDYPLAPGNPGHEGWGTVDVCGEGVEGIDPGTRVAFLSSSAFAEFDIAAVESIVPLDDIPAGEPFPGEALGCAFNIFRRSDIQPGQNVAIVGVGFLGAILCRLAATAGARVIAISRRPFSLEVARQSGASETVAMDDHWKIIDRVKELTGGAGCERVIEAVGLQWPLDLAAELTAERGRLVIAGYHQDGVRQVNMQLWNWRGLDVVNAHERDPRIYAEGIREAVTAVSRGELDPRPLYTTFELDRIGDAFEAMRNRPDGFLKAVVMVR